MSRKIIYIILELAIIIFALFNLQNKYVYTKHRATVKTNEIINSFNIREKDFYLKQDIVENVETEVEIKEENKSEANSETVVEEKKVEEKKPEAKVKEKKVVEKKQVQKKVEKKKEQKKETKKAVKKVEKKTNGQQSDLDEIERLLNKKK